MKRNMQFLMFFTGSCLLAGCASHEPIADNSSGPVMAPEVEDRENREMADIQTGPYDTSNGYWLVVDGRWEWVAGKWP
jgi:hypothetical protein